METGSKLLFTALLVVFFLFWQGFFFDGGQFIVRSPRILELAEIVPGLLAIWYPHDARMMRRIAAWAAGFVGFYVALVLTILFGVFLMDNAPRLYALLDELNLLLVMGSAALAFGPWLTWWILQRQSTRAEAY